MRPGICFRAAPMEGKDGTVDANEAKNKRIREERRRMPADVTVYYQQKAWFDSQTCLAYARRFRKQMGTQAEKLVGMDNLGAQCSPVYPKKMR